MKHPHPNRLALLAGGELSLWARLPLHRHLLRCPACAQELYRLRETRALLARSSDDLPADLDWDRLAAEMKANIHLGLEAGALASPAEGRLRPRALASSWQWAAVSASLALVLFSGWFLSKPRDFYHRVEPAVASATPEGIGVNEKGSAMTLLAPAAAVSSSADIGEGVQARYVDADSGQVTIHHVFAE